jgi:hypothetical protein
MRSGSIPFPAVSVNICPPSRYPGGGGDGQSEGASAGAGLDVSCETHVENGAEVVRVLPARREVMALVPVRAGWDVIEEGLRAVRA